MERNDASAFVGLPARMLEALENRFSDMRFVWQQVDALGNEPKVAPRAETGVDTDEALACLRLKAIRVMSTDDADDHALVALGTFELYLSLTGGSWSLARAWQRLEELVVFMHQNRWESLVGAACVQNVACLSKSFPEEGLPEGFAYRIEWAQQLYWGRRSGNSGLSSLHPDTAIHHAPG